MEYSEFQFLDWDSDFLSLKITKVIGEDITSPFFI